MSFKSQIRPHMPVKNVNGEKIGKVDDIDGDRIKLTAHDSTDNRHHYIPLSDVSRVDEHVHLKTAGLAPGSLAAADAASRSGGGLGRLLPWLLLALGAIVLILWLRGSFDGRDDGARGVTDTGTFSSANENSATPATTADTGIAAAGVGTLGAYLGSPGEVPATFVFDKLNFDTGKSTVRPVDKPELDAVAATLKQYDATRVRVVGFADARGAEPANAALGTARADAVKAALVASGIDAGRIETASGGESEPVDSNQTPGGRAENRRTELVVTAR